MTEKEYVQTLERSRDARIACRFDEAATLATEATEAYPGESSGWHTLAMVSSDIGMYDDALYCRERAVELLPKPIPNELVTLAQQVHFGLANSLLLHGQFERAWPHWELGRLGYSWTPATGTTYWPSGDVESLLVICEGGYGDLFNFSRWLPKLREMVNGDIGLFVQRGLRKYWSNLVYPAYVDEIMELGESYSTTGWKHSIGILSLPAHLGMKSITDVPVWHDPYPVRRKNTQKRIGFCWRSEENMSPRRIRSLTFEEASAIAIQLADDGHRVLSLSPAYKDISISPDGLAVECPCGAWREPEQMATWGDTAAYVRTMDLVLTVDTAVAHLAGMAGVPTLCLLPLNVDWKWGMTGEWTPWYGPEFRLFRNPLPKSWEMIGIVDRIREMLK